VIGVNTAIISGAQGIAFAVPVETVSWVVGDLIAHGKVQRASLGMKAQQVFLPPRLARTLRSRIPSRSRRSGQGPGPIGARTAPLPGAHRDIALAVAVVGVTKGGAAAKAGIRENEVIVAVNGGAVSSLDDLYAITSRARAGDSAVLTILEEDTVTMRNVSVTLDHEPAARA
jgi:S1-C subfamily serine protease